MAESDRGRAGKRRIGDDTARRIDGLASGWLMDSAPGSDPAVPPGAAPDHAGVAHGTADSLAAAAPRAWPHEVVTRGPLDDDRAVTVRGAHADRPKIGPETLARVVAERAAPALCVEATVARVRRDEAAASTSAVRPLSPPLRGGDTVPRRRGVVGDVQYVFAALFGVARARHALADHELGLVAEREGRDRARMTVAAYALESSALDPELLAPARTELFQIERERDARRGMIAAAEAQVRQSEAAGAEGLSSFEAADVELAARVRSLDEQLPPQRDRVVALERRRAEHERSAAALDAAIVAAERSLAGGEGEGGTAAVEARLAAIRAERAQLRAEALAVTTELDELSPLVATLEAQRRQAELARAAEREREQQERKRAADEIRAAEARAEEARAHLVDAERARDAALVALGTQLERRRPPGVAERLGAVDERATAIATLEREALELRALLGAVDRAAIARGLAYLALAAALSALAVWLVVAR